ncbi:MAG: hypothetical protein Q8O30_04745 [Candidatus Omnitrophota bacterium]|nr:hypothetical protein [Candidatus Omnitrophota bacterium]
MKIIKIQLSAFLCAIFFSFFLLDFCQAENIESKYFTIIFDCNCDFAEFVKKIDLQDSLNLDNISSGPQDIKSIVAESMDKLYLEISDVLDIHMYSYHGKIKVFSTKQEMLDTAFRGASMATSDLPGLYMPTDNTIYISFSDFTLGMLSHEIAHAIICNYFVTPPPLKVQEILAGYVEYSVRKKAGDLNINKH